MAHIRSTKKRLRSSLLFFAIAVSLLSSCGPNKNPANSAYASSLSYHEGFKILQLTDLHWSIETDVKRQSAYLDAILSYSDHPDFVMLTGDNNLLSNKEVTTALYRHIQSWSVPYGVSWGNHDRGNEYSFPWLEGLVEKGLSVYKNPSDNVSGDSNYAVNLVSGGATKWRLYSLDSHSLVPHTPFRYAHPPIDKSQIDWFESLASEAAVPSLAFCHLPLEETQKAADLSDSGLAKSKWEHLESISPAYENDGFFASAKAAGVKGVFYGHDHSNDLAADYEGVTLAYGVKTGRELYYRHSDKNARDLTGAGLITLHDDGSFDLDHLYVEDSEGFPLTKERYQ